jgi:carbonic anhydrase
MRTLSGKRAFRSIAGFQVSIFCRFQANSAGFGGAASRWVCREANVRYVLADFPFHFAIRQGKMPNSDAADDLIAGYRRFRKGRYREASQLFRSLRDGQQPNTMIIACADSRADPSMIFDAAPGELFVVRNVTALVPPYDESGGWHGTSAAIEFAVTRLKVKEIVVMGHGGCGGVMASLSAAADRPVGRFIAEWVEILAPARDAVLADKSVARDDWQEAVEHGAVGLSLANLMSFPFIREAVEAGELRLDGSWFSIGRGELHWRNPATGKFGVVASDAAPSDRGDGV